MLKFNNKVLHINDKWLNPNGAPVPPGPGPDTPTSAGTIRALFKDGVVPVIEHATLNQISQSPNIWDVTSTGWSSIFYEQYDLIAILGANPEGVSSLLGLAWMCYHCTSLEYVNWFDTSMFNNMDLMFSGCTLLKSVPLFDTSNVTIMNNMFSGCTSLETVPTFNTSNVTTMTFMFEGCSSLKEIPLFNTNKVERVEYAFNDCSSVESGALALYQQMSTQTNPPTNHTWTFHNCGKNTTTGAAELAQIPSDWK